MVNEIGRGMERRARRVEDRQRMTTEMLGVRERGETQAKEGGNATRHEKERTNKNLKRKSKI